MSSFSLEPEHYQQVTEQRRVEQLLFSRRHFSEPELTLVSVGSSPFERPCYSGCAYQQLTSLSLDLKSIDSCSLLSLM